MIRLVPCLLPGLAVAAAGYAASPYMGSEACAPCHRQEYDRQTRSRHARALRPIAQSPIAEVLLKTGLPDDAVRYEARAGGISATARWAGNESTGLLEWAFGAGSQGITPVGKAGGQFFEHRFSYYPGARRMALTFGHPARVQTAASELGLPQSAHTIATCFQCHSTGVEETPAGPDLSGIQPGVQCERCHGPGRQHIQLAEARAAVAEIRRALLNPGRLAAKAQVEVCGQCHRLPPPNSASPEPEIEDPVNVRFAPMGLLASRCFLESRRLACTTCHDPHEDARARSDASYRARCAGCHSAPPKPGSTCRRDTGQDCLPCHMRQASLGALLKFTDHRIRVP